MRARLPNIHRIQSASRVDRRDRGHRQRLRPGGDAEAIVVPTLGRDDGGLERFLTSAATAFVAGVNVDWRGVLDGAGFVELPTYAFDRRRFWLSGEGVGRRRRGLGAGNQRAPAAERGRGAAGLGWGGVDGPVVAQFAGLAGRSRRVRCGGVPRRRVCRVGDPRRRRSRLLDGRRTDAASTIDVAGQGFRIWLGCGAGGGGSRRRIRSAQRVDIFALRYRLRLGAATPRGR